VWLPSLDELSKDNSTPWLPPGDRAAVPRGQRNGMTNTLVRLVPGLGYLSMEHILRIWLAGRPFQPWIQRSHQSCTMENLVPHSSSRHMGGLDLPKYYTSSASPRAGLNFSHPDNSSPQPLRTVSRGIARFFLLDSPRKLSRAEGTDDSGSEKDPDEGRRDRRAVSCINSLFDPC